jgi:folate-binding protein YgfZ
MTTRSSASPPPQPPAGYRDLRHHVAWAALPDRGRVMVRGRDALAFVDHFTTAAVTRLAEGGGCEGFFPDARGHVIALATILRTADGVVIDVGAGRGPSLAAHLEHHHIREAVEIVDESAGHAVVCVSGPDAAGWLVSRAGAVPTAPLGHVATSLGPVPALIVRCDPCGPEGYIVQVAAAHAARLVAWFAEQGLPSAADAAFEAARIEEGTPLPADLPEKTLPQEVDRDERAICFTKGCYLGQETVARIDALGHVNRRLVALATAPADATGGAGAVPAVGTEVRSGADVVGRVTSACFSPLLGTGLALAIVHNRAVAGPLTIDGQPARIVPLPVRGGLPATDAAAAGETLLETRRFRVVRVVEQCADGTRRDREVVLHPGSVVILPFVSSDSICLVEVVRTAVGATLLELPAGTLDRVESLADAAARELAEETGYRAGRLTAAGAFWMSPGILRERMHLFVAEDLTAGPQALEPGEQIQTRIVSWDEAVAMCRDGRIEDAKTIAAVLRIAARRAAGPGSVS